MKNSVKETIILQLKSTIKAIENGSQELHPGLLAALFDSIRKTAQDNGKKNY